MERPPGRRTCLYDAEQLDAVVERMALQAAALLRGCERIAVIGLLRRGAPLAERITTLMVERHGMAPLRQQQGGAHLDRDGPGPGGPAHVARGRDAAGGHDVVP